MGIVDSLLVVFGWRIRSRAADAFDVGAAR
jgi:hypothetical protein